MSHCRYQNTLEDLQDCVNNMVEIDWQHPDDLSRDEFEAMYRLHALCSEVSSIL